MKTFLLSLFIVVTLLFTTNNASKAACPTGWTSHPITYMYNGCEITVYYCFLLSPGGTNQVKIDGIYIPADCVDEIDFDDPNFWERANDEIINYLIPSVSITNCNSGYFTLITVTRTNCWKLVILQGGYGQVQACEDTGNCFVVNRLCANYSTNPPIIQNTKSYGGNAGSNSCSYGYVPDGPYTFPYQTDCFYTCE
jgi:hypothetical protein